MSISWIAPSDGNGHVRDVRASDRAQLLAEDYTEFRLTCSTPSGTREGDMYIQSFGNTAELASHAEKCGRALFGGCTTTQVHTADGTALLWTDAEAGVRTQSASAAAASP